MPKMKTKKAAAKRFTLTGSGKIKYFNCNKQHILTKKTPKRKRNLRKANILDKTCVKQTKRMLPYA